MKKRGFLKLSIVTSPVKCYFHLFNSTETIRLNEFTAFYGVFIDFQ